MCDIAQARKEAGGGPHAARLGLGPGMGAGQRVPSVAEGEGARPGELELGQQGKT